MSTKKDNPKTKDEERFYQFARALISVPKKELDKQLDKHEREKDLKIKKRNTKLG